MMKQIDDTFLRPYQINHIEKLEDHDTALAEYRNLFYRAVEIERDLIMSKVENLRLKHENDFMLRLVNGRE